MNERRRYSVNADVDTIPTGLDIIKRAESYRAEWYKCPSGVWTIGLGTTENSLPGVNRSKIKRLSREDAEGFLAYALSSIYEPAVESRVRVPLSPGEFSALVSLVYNIGGPQFATSTLLRLLNAGDYRGAAGQFARWVRGGGRVLPGLVRRRAAERALFLSDATADPRAASEVSRRIAGLVPLDPMPVEPLPMRASFEVRPLPTFTLRGS